MTGEQGRGLAGLRVVVTRSRRKGQAFAAVLAAWGATPLLFPSIQTVAIQPNPALNRANQNLDRYDWLVFTSPKAVRYWANSSPQPVGRSQVKVACIGTETAAAWQKVSQREADLRPDTFTAVGLLMALPDVAGQTILIPQSAIAHDTLATGLRQAGATVEAIPTYETKLGEPTPEEWAALRAGA
ncbi:MAG: uroporphyrinogen-III synthase, partial [Anaerolineales bacterium]|nr:uroporphyrinogen-III synthase [Anaerolineales bacterium]